MTIMVFILKIILITSILAISPINEPMSTTITIIIIALPLIFLKHHQPLSFPMPSSPPLLRIHFLLVRLGTVFNLCRLGLATACRSNLLRYRRRSYTMSDGTCTNAWCASRPNNKSKRSALEKNSSPLLIITSQLRHRYPCHPNQYHQQQQQQVCRRLTHRLLLQLFSHPHYLNGLKAYVILRQASYRLTTTKITVVRVSDSNPRSFSLKISDYAKVS
mmetsp:Transcript_28526/g.52498  ORF Transcript_28526/g.52498 Transcript_28526/m.52498 type:complete len:218 (-) Transcript_28526:168-821(-)